VLDAVPGHERLGERGLRDIGGPVSVGPEAHEPDQARQFLRVASGEIRYGPSPGNHFGRIASGRLGREQLVKCRVGAGQFKDRFHAVHLVCLHVADGTSASVEGSPLATGFYD
jgi:hypothetical protein